MHRYFARSQVGSLNFCVFGLLPQNLQRSMGDRSFRCFEEVVEEVAMSCPLRYLFVPLPTCGVGSLFEDLLLSIEISYPNCSA